MPARADLARARKGLIAIVWVTAAVCVYAMRQADPDLFGYLAYGRLFVQGGGVTTTDPFAYTSQGFHWVPFEYIAQILLWTSYDHFGPLGLIGLKCLVGGAAIYFLYVAVRTASDDPIVWVPVFLLSTAVVSRFFLFRPQLFTFALFALFVSCLFGFLTRRGGPLWILPPAMLLWANLHGGFVAGLGAIGLAVLLRICGNLNAAGSGPRSAFEGTRPLLWTLAACAAASFVNPQGARLWLYVLREISHDTNRRYVAEWGPVSFRGDVWSATALTLSAVTLVGLGWLAARGERRLDAEESSRLLFRIQPWQWVVSCGPLVAMAYGSVRHVPIATIWAAPVIALLASAVKSSKAGPVFRGLWAAFASFAVASIGLTVAYVIANPRPVIATGGRVLGSKHPCRAVAFIRGNGLAGNLYTPLWWGSYITWELYPAIRVSMDGRNISLFPDGMVAENLRFYSRDVSASDLDVPLRYNTDLLLVPSDSAVLGLARTDPRWQPLYADDDSALFARADRARQSIRSSIETASVNLAPEGCAQALARR
jgi:hypothetical protein